MIWSNRSLVWILRGLALTAVLVLVLFLSLTIWTIRRHDIRFLSVQSGSMEPAIKTGDAVIIRDVVAGDLSAGDVISYRTAENSAITTHRIHSMKPETNQIVTKGDANNTPDGVIDTTYLEGQAVAIAPSAGKIASILQSPAGLIVFVYLPVTAVVVRELLRLQRSLRKPYRLNR